MMEQPIITSADERLVGGNMDDAQIKEMRSHNRFTTIMKQQNGWTFKGVGKTDTYAVPWHFILDNHPYHFIATQYKNMFGSETVTIFICDEKFNYDLNVMAEVKSYVGHIDLETTVNKFAIDFESIIEDIES